MSEKNTLQNFWNSVNNDIYYEKVGLCYFHSRRECMKLNKRIEQKIQFTLNVMGSAKENSKDFLINIKDPRNHYMICWNCMVIAVSILACAFIPFLIGFRCPFTSFTYCLLLAIDFTFALDIIMTFHTAYYHLNTSTYIFDRKQILWNYLSFWFWIDIIGMLPLDILINLTVYGNFFVYNHSHEWRYVFRLLYILKLTKMHKIFEFKQILSEYNFHSTFISAQSLALRLFFVSHCISCIWNFIATFDNNPLGGPSNGDSTSVTVTQQLVNITTTTSTGITDDTLVATTWVYEYGFEDSSVFERYVASLYWSITTMLTVGYGDIHAVNSDEKIFSIFIELFGVVVFGAIVAQMVEILKNINPRKKAIKLAVDELMSYLHEYNRIPQPLMAEAKAACVYFMNKSSSFAESEILEKLQLPDAMLQYFITNAYGNKINRIALFKREGVDNEFILDIVTCMKPFLMQDHGIILNFDDVIDELVFVMTGSVQMITTTTAPATETDSSAKHSGSFPVILGQVSPGGYFGDMEYEKVCLCLATYRANGRSSLYSLTYVDLNNALERMDKLEDDFHRECQEKYDAWKVVTASGFTTPPPPPPDNNNHTENVHSSPTVIFQNQLWMDGKVESNEKFILHHLNRTEKDHLKSYHLTLKYDHETKTIVKAKETYTEINQRWIIEPQNSHKLLWDVFICLLLFYCIFSTTIILCFYVETPQSINYLDLLVDAIFFVDIIVVARTAFFNDQEVLVTVFSLIVRKYLQRWFWVDLVSSIPFDLMTNISGLNLSLLKLFKIFRVFRFFKLNRVMKMLRWVEDNWSAGHSLLEILKLMGSVVVVSHIVACLWWVLPDTLSASTWFDTSGLRDSSLSDQYLTSLYWTVTTLTTVGYGDIAATNSPERIIACFVMLLGGVAFGYIVGNLSSLLGNMNPSAKIIDSEVKMVRGFLEERSLSHRYIGNVLKYFRNKLLHNSVFDEEAILSKLPTRLDRQILSYRHAETISSLRIFKYIPNRSVVLYLFRHIEPHLFQADTLIAQEGRVVTGIVMIVSGKVSLSKAVVSPHKLQNLVKKQMNARAQKRGAWRTSTRFSSSITSDISTDEFKIPKMFGNFPAMLGRATRKKGIFPEEPGVISPRGASEKSMREEVVVAHREAGELLGAEELMVGSTHKHTAKAVLPTNTYVLSQSNIASILVEAPAVGLYLQQALVSLLLDRNHWMLLRQRKEYRRQFVAELVQQNRKLKRASANAAASSPAEHKADKGGLANRSSTTSLKSLLLTTSLSKRSLQKSNSLSPKKVTPTGTRGATQPQALITNRLMEAVDKVDENTNENHKEDDPKTNGDGNKDNNGNEEDEEGNVFGAFNDMVNNLADCLADDEEEPVASAAELLLGKYAEEQSPLMESCHEQRGGLQQIGRLKRASSDPMLLRNEVRKGRCDYVAKARRCAILSRLRRRAVDYPSLDTYQWEHTRIQTAVAVKEKEKITLVVAPIQSGAVGGTNLLPNISDIVNMATSDLRLDFDLGS